MPLPIWISNTVFGLNEHGLIFVAVIPSFLCDNFRVPEIVLDENRAVVNYPSNLVYWTNQVSEEIYFVLARNLRAKHLRAFHDTT